MTQENAIQKCDDAIDLIESGLATEHEVMQAMAFKQKLGEIYRAVSHRFEEAAIKWIDAHGEIVEGDKRWFVGTVTKRSCKNVPEAVRTILESDGPDALVRALSTSCFRPATAMEILGERAGEFFTTETVPDLKTGKPRKALKGVPLSLGKGQTEDESED